MAKWHVCHTWGSPEGGFSFFQYFALTLLHKGRRIVRTYIKWRTTRSWAQIQRELANKQFQIGICTITTFFYSTNSLESNKRSVRVICTQQRWHCPFSSALAQLQLVIYLRLGLCSSGKTKNFIESTEEEPGGLMIQKMSHKGFKFLILKKRCALDHFCAGF